ncbi:MAG: CBS domain-containing protein [Candidatus Omnitrophica bacterium]|nr:CBS domain-containing protein [Candidatus Omnitrophota bacterium]
MLKTSLENIMTDGVVTLKEDASIGQAAHILLRYRINGIPIVKKNNPHKIIGIVTTTDLLRLLDEALSKPGQRQAELDKIGDMPVAVLAAKNVLTVQKNTSVEKAIAIMHREGKHTIPVYDGDKLIGVVGRHDLLNIAFG